MKSALLIVAVALLFFVAAPPAHAALPPKITQWEGVIDSINANAVSVKSQKGTRLFSIHPGTVFGQRAAKTASDFKPGDTVIVVFSEIGGQVKAENIRNPADDKKPGAKKAAKKEKKKKK